MRIITKSLLLVLALGLSCNAPASEDRHQPPDLVSWTFTPHSGFTSGVEGPAVDSKGTIYAVNFARQGTIGQIDPESGDASLFVQLPDSSIGNGIRFNRAGHMFIADYTGHNILMVDLETKAITTFAHEPTMNQPNDLAITDTDIIFASDPNWKESTGQLWRIDTAGQVTLLESNMGTTNGIEVSPDNRTLYVNESVQRKVWAYDLDESGNISNKRELISFQDFGLDGMRCDQQGNLYLTRYDKGAVVVVSPQGEILKEYTTMGKKPSNIAFGGKDGKTCYVTMADLGNLETFRTDVPGRSWILTQE